MQVCQFVFLAPLEAAKRELNAVALYDLLGDPLHGHYPREFVGIAEMMKLIAPYSFWSGGKSSSDRFAK
jgi:hypothetical protein